MKRRCSDTSSVSSAQTFDTRMVESLPMLSNMPIMLTRFAAGVNPATNQSLVSQGFVDGTTTAAGESFGGVGSNTYSIDGAANNSTNRRIATSPNSDMVEEMRVESSNFDASIGHGTGLQISMTTRAGANAFRGTGNYQYWTNKFNNLNPSQKATFTPSGKALYDEGRSHNTAWTFGGPIVQNKMFFFANYSYVNDFIPGKNQGTSTIPANEAHLRGDFSDLLRLPNPAQYQIYDPLTVRPDPARPGQFIRTAFPNNIIPANRIVNPLYNLYKGMVPKPNQNFVEQGTTPSNNYYRGGEPDIPKSTLVAARVDYNMSNNDRIFIRGSKNTFIEGVGDWTYEVPEYAGLHSIDRSRPQWNMIGNWTHTTGTMVIDTQVAANRFTQGDLLNRLHEFKPTRHGAAHVPRRTLRVAGELHAAAGEHRRLSGDFARRKLVRSREEPARDGERHEGDERSHLARRRRRAAGAAAAQPRRHAVGPVDVQQRVHAAVQRYRSAHAEQPRIEHGGVHAWHSPAVAGDNPAWFLLSQPIPRRVSGRTRGV